jgi:cardiolipin synthase
VTVLVFARDLGILVVAAILYAGMGMRNFRPSLFGKANTLAQILALVSVLLSRFYASEWVLFARHWSLQATIVLTVVSGFHYAWRVARRLGAPSQSAGLKAQSPN